MFKNKVFQILILILCVNLFGISIVLFVPKKSINNSTNLGKASDRIKVSTSFYPLKYITENIAEDKVIVDNITPAGSEPHDYEPSLSQINNVYNSKLFVYSGAGLDPWTNKIVNDLNSKNVPSLKVSDGFELGKIVDDESEIGETITDPHIWLDPINMISIGQKTRDSLIKIDSANKSYYETNFNNFTKEMNSLDAKFRTDLSNCKLNTIITAHNAFQYLGKRYNFKTVAINGVSPDSEPSTQDLVELTKIVKENKVKYIFTETLASPKLSETIARETGSQILVLNPIEGLTEEQAKNRNDWKSVMIENLNNLKIALECQ